MALFLFTKNILEGRPIEVFNHGKHKRDFTYVSDIAGGVIAAIDHIARADPDWNPNAPNPNTSSAPFRLFNIGNQQPVELMRYIEVIENCLGLKAKMEFLPLQRGDVPDTWADVASLSQDVNYRSSTSVEEGVQKFVDWYRSYYRI
jgi:UDP-glucuronate 4-epimerase